MGLTHVRGVVKHGDRWREVDLLVDSGATYTVLKKEVWEYLGLRPMRRLTLILADGTRIERWLSEALLELPGHGEYHTPVVLGEDGDENILGAVTLEIFGLMLDPLRRELRPMRILMMSSRASEGLSARDE